ncbi:hypothetical protein KIN20_023166 [Parelaphostrongylus tenuis]|uniref:Uncharacterized protein n=1 Tax=Parelaphostrongylus tenuis TaxID=148309 RepID=A0AAD5N692_PARTN|nr:hypothetical protein KIN20_023166 [Parelaphostrongylus tenuis]
MFQLIDKGENVDNQCMYRKVLSKFPSDTQRKVLAKKTTAVFFDMQTLLQLLDEAISNEELLSRYMTNARTPNTIRIDARPVSATVKQMDTGISRWTPQTSSTCMYCKGDHKPLYCNQYKTPQERYQYLKTKNLCYICASPSHATSPCKGSSCCKWQKRHHTSSCFYSVSKEKPSAPFPNKGTNKNEVKTKPNKPHTSKINHIAHHESSKSGNETTPARKVDMVDKSVENH